MVRHVDVCAMSRHTFRSAHHEIDPQDVDDAPAEPARALVDGVAIEMPARHVDERRPGDPRHRTCNAQAVEQAHQHEVYSEVG